MKYGFQRHQTRPHVRHFKAHVRESYWNPAHVCESTENGVWPKKGYVSLSFTCVRCTLTYVSHHFPPLLVSLHFQTLVRTFLRLLTPDLTRTTSFNIQYSSLTTNHHHKHSKIQIRNQTDYLRELSPNVRGITHELGSQLTTWGVNWWGVFLVSLLMSWWVD